MADPQRVDEPPARTLLGLPIATAGAAVQLPPRRRLALEGTELLGRYQVEGVIGEGGMATVYRGRHSTILRELAIKVLDPALDGVPDAVERFLQEAQVTSRVEHENVVEVTDFGVTPDGVVFCVMELLHGETLAELIAREAPLPVSRTAALMRQICGALQAAHDRGVIHRDLKPENCFRAPRTSNADFIKVLDFGIARVEQDRDSERGRRAARPRRTQVGIIVGTPDYMAPEQARAERFDHRVDVYAAGCLLFELVTGRAPYERESAAETIAAHLGAAIPDPRELVPGLPSAISAVIGRAMAKRADDRYASMAELSAALDEASIEHPRARGGLRWLSASVALTGVLAVVMAAMSTHATPPAGLAMAALASVPAIEAPPPPAAPPPPIAVPLPEPISAAVPPPPAVTPDPKPRRRSPARARDEPPPAALPAPTAELVRTKISEVKDPFADPG